MSEPFARGRIVITDNFAEVSKAASSAASSISGSLRGLQSALSSVGKLSLPTGLLAGLGVKAATDIEQFKVGLTALGSSFEEVAEIAGEFNQPILKIAEGAQALLPAANRAGVSLEKMLLVAQQLAVTNPAQGIQGASVALSEFLAGQFVSLRTRFNLTASDVSNAFRSAGGDVETALENLSEILPVSEKAIKSFGETGANALQQLRDDFTILLSDAFGPFLNNVLKPAISTLRDFIAQLRETNPELLAIAGSVTAITAAVAALSAALAPIVGVLAAVFAGPIGLAAAVGAVVAIAGIATKANQEGVGFGEALKMIVVDLADAVGNFIAFLMEGINNLGSVIVDVRSTLQGIGLIQGEQLDPLEGLINRLGGVEGVPSSGVDPRAAFINLVDLLNQAVEQGIARPLAELDITGNIESDTQAVIAELVRAREQAIQGLDADQLSRITGAVFSDENIEQARSFDKTVEGFINTIGGAESVISPKSLMDRFRDAQNSIIDSVSSVKAEAEQRKEALSPVFEGVLDEFEKYQEDILDIQQKAQADREEAERNHEQRRNETVREFARRREQQLQDEETRRQRAAQDTQQKILDIQKNAQREEAAAVTEYRNELASIRSDTQQEILEQDRDFQNEQEKRHQDHLKRLRDLNNSLSEAAASLDATAVNRIQNQIVEEERGFSEVTTERENEQRQRITQIRQDAQERINETQRAFEVERAERRNQAEQRVNELRQNFALEEQRRAEDFAIRMQRANEQHQIELQRMDQQFAQEQALIAQRESEAIAARQQQFIDWYNAEAEAAGKHASVMIGIQKQGQRALEQDFVRFWGNLRRQQVGAVGGIAGQFRDTFVNLINGVQSFARDASGTISRFFGSIGRRQAGGPVSANLPYLVGEAGPEIMVPRSQGTVLPNSAMAGNVNIGDVSMVFPGITDRTKTDDVRRIVYQEFERVFLSGGS